jgi:nitroreductase
MSKKDFIPYQSDNYSSKEVSEAASSFRNFMEKRRSVRDYSSKAVPKEVIEDLIMTASSAPSGANKQPWVFCAISDREMKKKIRIAAEKEEYDNYHHRMSEQWLKDLEHLGTNEVKEFLEDAPWLIVVMRKTYDIEDGERKNVYYVNESVGIAAGMLITAIHKAGLVTLTHTPSPMGFLSKILDRPINEKPFLLLPVGYPKEAAEVPNITKKDLSEVSEWF